VIKLQDNSNDNDDKILIEEILGGSQAAMEVLVNKYYKMIFSYIYRSIGHYHTSYDLTQEVFIKMLKAISKYDREAGSFQSWIFKIAVNTVKDYFKSSGYRAFREAVEVDVEKCDESSNSNVVEMVSRMSESEQVKKAVLQLDQSKREAILLRFYHDMKIKDIAKITDTNESTIKSRLRQGIDKLRTILKEGGEHDDQGLGV
jgi:RNA polymerase sigma factor (sigma-70 family)